MNYYLVCNVREYPLLKMNTHLAGRLVLLQDNELKYLVCVISNLKVPDYYKTIKRGMCYDMVAHKLRNGFYSQVEEFVDDMKLVYSNCYQYHEVIL